MTGNFVQIRRLIPLSALLLLAGAWSVPVSGQAGWDAVLAGYRSALHQSGIVGSSLLMVKDGRVAALATEGAAFAKATAGQGTTRCTSAATR